VSLQLIIKTLSVNEVVQGELRGRKEEIVDGV
jgi:hypothetical protein